MFLIGQIFLFIIIFVAALLSFWIYFQNRKKKVNKLFFISSFFLLVWVLFGHLITIPGQAESSVIFRTKIAYIGVYGWLVSMYFFLKNFPKKDKKQSLLLGWAVVIIGVSLSGVTIFTDLLVKGAQIKEFYPHPELGRGTPFIYAIIFILFVLLFRNIHKKYFSLTSTEKRKVQYLLLGLIIFLLFNLIFNVFISPIYGMVPWAYIANYAAIFFLSFTAYAIVKQNLFGIKVVLTSLIVGLIAILLGVDLIFFTKELWIQISKGVILIIFLAFGYFLVKSVIREIKRKEELEKLSDKLVETNTELKEANKKLRKLDKAKSEFISIASHQLRTPLTAIKGYLSMIISGSYGEISGEVRDKMEKVLKSSDRLINLVNDLLDASRLESGKLEMKFEEVDLNKYITDIVEEFKVVAEEEELYLNLETGEDMLVHMDKERIRQAILNVVDNAIKYTEEGGIVIRTKKKISDSQEFVLIEIEDTGQGMSEEEIDNIFKSFSRGSAGDLMHIEGAGLGLYIAKKFVDMHQGEIWLESEGKEQGTAFFVELPLSQK